MNNEFNLATAYQHTGRSMLAIPLYEDLAKNGKYITGYYIYDYYRTKATDPASFNYAAEATRRLDVILSQSQSQYPQILAQREEGDGSPP